MDYIAHAYYLNIAILENKMKNRIVYIDIFKGIAILLVIIGHLKIHETLYTVIFSFHMYLFYFIAGMTFDSKKSFKSLIIRGFFQLIVPYLFFAIICDISGLIQNWYLTKTIESVSASSVFEHFLSIVLCKNYFTINVSIGPAWFLVSLFVVRLGYYFICKVSELLLQKRRITRKLGGACENIVCADGMVIVVISFALFILGYILRNQDVLPWKLIPSLSAYFFFAVGNCIRNCTFVNRIKSGAVWKKIIGIVFSVISIVFFSSLMCSPLELVSNKLPDNFMAIIVCGLMGCFAVMLLSMAIEQMGNTHTIHRLLTFFGKNSLIIMGTHSQVLLFYRLLLELIGIKSYSTALPVFILTVFTCYPLVKIFNHFPMLIGKHEKNQDLRWNV